MAGELISAETLVPVVREAGKLLPVGSVPNRKAVREAVMPFAKNLFDSAKFSDNAREERVFAASVYGEFLAAALVAESQTRRDTTHASSGSRYDAGMAQTASLLEGKTDEETGFRRGMRDLAIEHARIIVTRSAKNTTTPKHEVAAMIAGQMQQDTAEDIEVFREGVQAYAANRRYSSVPRPQ